ncbi:MAG: hypothetical protein ABW215_15165, partial [Kibdelosporangium sp.]
MAGRAGLPRVDVRKIVAGGAIAIVIGGIAAAVPVDPVTQQPDVVTDTPPGGISLVAFDSCETALSGLRRSAWPYIGPFGFDGGSMRGLGRGGDDVATTDAGGAAPMVAAGESAASRQDTSKSSQQQGKGQPGHATTNNH